eukprot:CAMPEP_0116137530 /NCGR_PEP_ID=MMETSP0329-20121206/12294_1 /TAXON_ID=697910 /ORGANISM="Pseudo-nitzschia arenysensis, Strain B593" /LENGTH=526 /DNA_ID=CAMNT_0003632445 /DNA_START=44 /DNA_END=1624 /DNA_ORIENTATION=-
MKEPMWIRLAKSALLCLLFNAYLCAGEGDLSQYLYETAEENQFVRDFTGDSDSRPDFIYSPTYPNGRLVTYYAHWCPHCIHFKPKYISFAEELQELSLRLDATVETFAVSCVPQHTICKDKGIHGFPTLMFYPPYSIEGTKINQFKLNAEEIFKMAAGSTTAQEGKSEMKQYSSQKSDEQKSTTSSYFASRKRSEAFHDAHLSFDFAMKTAIFTQNGPLPEKPKEALREFLFAMDKTLPSNSSMQTVVRNLLENFETIATSPVALEAIIAKYPPPEPTNKWSEASMQHGTGYTAGLWALFHIMSVGLVQWNHLAIDDEEKLTPAAMADILRNYIENFFQCEECRLNFLADFDACMYDRCNRLVTTTIGGTVEQYIQYPLWLFETHNAVNVRLRRERIDQNIEKEDFTKPAEVVWPSYSSCPFCWLSGDKDRWDEIEVYKFLQHTYWEEDFDSEVLRILTSGNSGVNNAKDFIGKPSMPMGGYKDGADSSHFIGSLCFVAMAFTVFWHRRRRYDQRGMHKKIETSLP